MARRVRHGHGTLLSACLLIVCAVILVALYAGSPGTAQAVEPAVVSNDAALFTAAPVRVEELTYMSVIPFETITYMDPELYIGETAVITEGRDGLRRVTETVEYSGGTRAKVISVSSTLIVEAIAETVAVGSLERPLTASYGTYIWPANGKLNSNFGLRSGGVGSTNHKGIDITGNKGDSIFAADGGEIIHADSSLSGFGKLIQIQHDNGEVTYYAHNSELLVKVGERVAQGQEIAKMGSTGVASGVHLHFELRIDGVPVNPVDYLP